MKPENCIVSLTRAELEEILKRGQLSTMNKTIRTHDVVSNNFFLGKQTNATSSVLLNVDTSGMTKLQKKKLKKKLKKQTKNEEEPKVEEDEEVKKEDFIKSA